MTVVDVKNGDIIRATQPILDIQLQVRVSGSSGGIPFADEFCLPMKNIEKAWYVAHLAPHFGPYEEHPPCADWNLESGGPTDEGEPLVAPWSGVVLSAHDWRGGTGRVVQILGVKPDGEMIVWAGWHLQEMHVEAGQIVQVGQLVGTIGNADGRYGDSYHLHEQIAIINERGVPAPFAYASNKNYDWQNSVLFYLNNGVDSDTVHRCSRYDGE